MAAEWSAWAGPREERSPYVDWWLHAGLEPYPDPAGAEAASLVGGFPAPVVWNRLAGNAVPPGAAAVMDRLADAFGDKAPVPAVAANPDFDPNADWAPPDAQLPVVDDLDAVIVGVVDSGVGLGNSLFRDNAGAPRILAAWQQTDAHPLGGTSSAQPYLPFGRELLQAEISGLLADKSGGNLAGRLDEDAFNTAAGLLDMRRLKGARVLAGRRSHGNHVAGAAAGIHPGADQSDAMKRLKMIVVNLPDRLTIGLSGTFLDFFIVHAIARIADLADLIWLKSVQAKGQDPDTFGRKGFRTVVNLSFGKQAGPKDGNGLFEGYLRELNDMRAAAGIHPVEVVLPVGNDNLLRGRAELAVAPGSQEGLAWRVLPEDQSSNYVEIWSPLLAKLDPGPAADQPVLLGIEVTPPGGQPLRPTAGQHGFVRSIDGRARLYCDLVEAGDGQYRVRYVLCTAPTLRPGQTRPAGQAGAWRIRVENLDSTAQTVSLSVQTDQSVLPGGHTGLRSYFDHPGYVRVDRDSGRVVDSYSYGPAPAPVLTDGAGPVRRRGTINATATVAAAVAIAGYRHSDGRPSPYSATGRGDAKAPGRVNPTAAFVSDDSPVAWGTLGAGARDGSFIQNAGTSFSSAQATRVVAEAWLAGGSDSAAEILAAHADVAAPYPGDAAKIGAGRKLPPAMYRVRRSRAR